MGLMLIGALIFFLGFTVGLILCVLIANSRSDDG
jgi:hypothetical protein